ncbi:glucuronosyltransferase [Mastigocoleus sp. MO_188.B34]|uniref:GumK N-terminal domain-containing glycosyltransferase n=1 Tax=Mastigocoleus sp. MO_188.B34 TaxID=3036635 RepID=UPI0026265238|nr:glucuronosyltransferase [Mastigocoleus sp. MO_188.B34]MDJ0697122.1 glucuronosyltransferase [Mastigocoleus sp. MO_188.B34]
MKRVILVTGHYWKSKRKAGFHWLADAFWQQGWQVVFMTAALSWMSVIRRDYRLAYPVLQEANKLLQVDDRIWSYVWFTPWHPGNLRLDFLNNLSQPLFSTYGELLLGEVEPMIKQADLFVFESTPALLLFKKFKRLNSNACYIYRVSDDLRFLRNHNVVLETEERIASEFDLISTPSQKIYNIFEGLPKLKLHLHGIRKDIFDQKHLTPYPPSGNPNLIFVGNSYFDYDFLEQASKIFPDWQFHIIGPIPNLPQRNNIKAYGELPFEKTIPYLKHADIALQTRSYHPGVESLSDSLKVIQYTYCQLPIIAPVFLYSSRSHIFYYHPNDVRSIENALKSAQAFDASQIQTDDICSWEELVCHWFKIINLYPH